MNKLLEKYFEKLEDTLVANVKLARKAATLTTLQGEGAEVFVAELLQKHLPARAKIAMQRQIVGADSGFPGQSGPVNKEGCNKPKKFVIDEERIDFGPSNPMDVVIYNEWTCTPNILEAGFVLVESLYLSIEVKCSKKLSRLGELLRKGCEQLALSKLKRRFRPETLYVGNVRLPSKLPVASFRTGRPTACLIGVYWGDMDLDNSEGEDGLQRWGIELLHQIIETVKSWEGCSADKYNGTTCKHPWHYPDVIYVPKVFLAFKVFTEIEVSRNKWKETPVRISEYPFVGSPLTDKKGEVVSITVDVGKGRYTGFSKIQYWILFKHNKPNLLYTYLFWLSQEILKFVYEVPDYHRYLVEDKTRLEGRHGAGITAQGCWGLSKYHNGEWPEPKKPQNDT